MNVRDLCVFRWYEFEAAHSLPHVAEGHKCRRVHGHNFRVQFTVRRARTSESAETASLLGGSGFVTDFFDLDGLVQPIIDMLDHRYLNEIEGLENPTSERIALYLAEKFTVRAFDHGLLSVELQRVVVQENDASGAVLDLELT